MAEEARSEDAGVVDDEQVSLAQVRGQVADGAVRARAGLTVQHEQAGLAARRGRLRYQLIRQIELEIRNQHGTKSAELVRNCTIFVHGDGPRRRESSVTDQQYDKDEQPVLPSSDQNAVVRPETPAAVVIRMPVDVRSLALTVIAAFAAVLMLQSAQSVLIPIVIGILIAYALAPLVNALVLMRLPRAVSAGVAVVLLVAGLGVGGYTLSDEVMSIVSNVPQAAQRVRQRISENRRSRGGALQQVQRAATEIDKAAAEASKTEAGTRSTGPAAQGRQEVQKVEVVDPPFRASDYLWAGGMGLLNMAGQFAMILFLVYFLLVTGDLYKRKLVKIAGPRLSQKKITIQILDAINLQIESFIRVQVLTSFIVAVATAVALWWFGVEQYIVWGLLAGVFNSIPYLGPILVTGGLGVVAFMQFDDVPKTISVCAVTLAITSFEGFLLTPSLMGRAAQMNPVAIFIGLLFWSWIWGVWGTVLAVPMLMMLKAICDHVEDLQPIGELLGE
jgi:predicted PurR-regulated permease PerM